MKLKQFFCFLLLLALMSGQFLNAPLQREPRQSNLPQSVTKYVGQPPKLSVPDQITQARNSKCTAQFNPRSKVQTRCFGCCSYNWIWAVDYSYSMNFLPLAKVHCMRWTWKTFFFDFAPCQQKVSTFGFNSIIHPGPDMEGYEEFSLTMDFFLPPPPAPQDPVTNYNLAIVKTITLIMASLSEPGHLNNCLILISDGGNIPLVWWNAILYNWIQNFVKNYPWNRCTCSMCYYVGNPGIGLSQFTAVCAQIGVTDVKIVKNDYDDNCYTAGFQLASISASKIFNPDTCYCYP